VVCEPSCLSAIKDDYLELKTKTPNAQARALAAKSFLVEEFIHAQWDQHPRPAAPSVPAAGPPVLLHGHCHQKSLWGQSSAPLLKRLLGPRLTVLDSGCCGMAGGFGYTQDHYDLSMKIGEQSLFGQLQSVPNDAIIVTPGTSCRHQIHDGTQRVAIHPITLAARLIR
jgi:Fe-S oxidoreductase